MFFLVFLALCQQPVPSQAFPCLLSLNTGCPPSSIQPSVRATNRPRRPISLVPLQTGGSGELTWKKTHSIVRSLELSESHTLMLWPDWNSLEQISTERPQGFRFYMRALTVQEKRCFCLNFIHQQFTKNNSS